MAFALLVAFVALPFLTPCGTIYIPARMIDAAVPEGASSRSTTNLQDEELRIWARREAPPAVMKHDPGLNRADLIQDAELAGCRKSSSSLRENVMFAVTLVDPFIEGVSSGGGKMEYLGSSSWRIVVLDRPFVQLRGGDRIRYVESKDGRGVSLALATGKAQVSIVSANGIWHAIADRIHYRTAGHELILEGAPLIKRGRQLLYPSSPDALVRIRLDSDTISSNKP